MSQVLSLRADSGINYPTTVPFGSSGTLPTDGYLTINNCVNFFLKQQLKEENGISSENCSFQITDGLDGKVILVKFFDKVIDFSDEEIKGRFIVEGSQNLEPLTNIESSTIDVVTRGTDSKGKYYYRGKFKVYMSIMVESDIRITIWERA